jgi:hypothetical protein
LPRRLFGAAEPQPGFMDQSGRLQSLPGRFARHFLRGEHAQFVIDDAEQLVRRLGYRHVQWLAKFGLRRSFLGCGLALDERRGFAQ